MKLSSKAEIEAFLFQVLNAPVDSHDQERVRWYQTQDPDQYFQPLGMTFEDLIDIADMLKVRQYDWSDFCKSRAEYVHLALTFNFEKLFTWVMGTPMQEEKENVQLLENISCKRVVMYSADDVVLVPPKEPARCAADALLEVHQSLHYEFHRSRPAEKRKTDAVELRKKPRFSCKRQ